VTGVKSSELDVLCNRFEEDLLMTTLHEPYRRKDCKRGKVREISTRNQILLFLVWIRHYPVERLLAWIFALNKKLVHTYNSGTLFVFYRYYMNKCKFPSREFRVGHSTRLRGALVTLVVDATEQHVLVSQDKLMEMATYSGKKNKHTFSVMIAASPDGHLCFISRSYVGSKTDLNIYQMPENHIHRNIEEDEWIIFDKGYRGTSSQFKNVALPFYGQWYNLSEKERKFNSDHAAIRVVVENFNKECKRFKICSNVFRVRTSDLEHAREIHHRVWIVVSGMVNGFVSPLRKD
jgi:hypothetical protein